MIVVASGFCTTFYVTLLTAVRLGFFVAIWRASQDISTLITTEPEPEPSDYFS